MACTGFYWLCVTYSLVQEWVYFSVDTDLMVGIGWLLMGCIIPISWEYILVANANERPLVSASVARTV